MPSLTPTDYDNLAETQLTALYDKPVSAMSVAEIDAYARGSICIELRVAANKLRVAKQRDIANAEKLMAMEARYTAWVAGGCDPDAVSIDGESIGLIAQEK